MALTVEISFQIDNQYASSIAAQWFSLGEIYQIEVSCNGEKYNFKLIVEARFFIQNLILWQCSVNIWRAQFCWGCYCIVI